MKRFLSVILSLVLLAGVICTNGFSVKAAEHPYQSDTVLTEDDFDAAPIPEYELPGKSRAYNFWEYSGDLAVAVAPDNADNHVLWYTQFYYGLGLAILGHDYETHTINDRIKVVPGVTYKVDFDLYVKGEVELGSNLEIGLAVGKDRYDGEIAAPNYASFLDPIVEVTRFREYSTLEEGWNSYTGEITVPEDADLSGGDALILWCKGAGKNAHAYIDNIKVTALAEGTSASDEKVEDNKEDVASKDEASDDKTSDEVSKDAEATGLFSNPLTYVIGGVVLIAAVAVVIVFVMKTKKKTE